MNEKRPVSIFGDAQVTPLGTTSSMEDVRTVGEMNKNSIDKLGVQSLAFIYGVAQFDKNTELVSGIEKFMSEQQGQEGVIFRTTMGLVLAESFSDAYLTWNNQNNLPEIPPELQQKTTDWIVEGLTSEELTEGQRALIKPVVINLLGRIDDELSDSILDEVHSQRIIESANITDEEIKKHQHDLIEKIYPVTVREMLRDMFGKMEE